MATQEDLVQGFLTETGPTTASNMRWCYGNGDSARYIIGGRDGAEAVLAEHQPINHVVIYWGYPRGFRMHRYDIHEQARTIRNAVSHHADVTETTYQVEIRDEPPRTDDRDDVPVNSYGETPFNDSVIE